MKAVGVRRLSREVKALLEEVAAGEELLLTRDGEPVAVLRAATPADSLQLLSHDGLLSQLDLPGEWDHPQGANGTSGRCTATPLPPRESPERPRNRRKQAQQ